MRIVIETTDQPEPNQANLAIVQTQRAAEVRDGGPAPAALLRRFGRIPEAFAAQESATTADPARADRLEDELSESDGGAAKLNPLRHGAAVAAQRQDSGEHRSGSDDVVEHGEHERAEDFEAD
jgi:hypothetical protein